MAKTYKVKNGKIEESDTKTKIKEYDYEEALGLKKKKQANKAVFEANVTKETAKVAEEDADIAVLEPLIDQIKPE